MASSSTLRASSSASNCDAYNYDVFMSFRGADTRNNFTDHLYHALVAYGIHTFRDDEELEKGGHIASNLWRAIEESKIFIIIFSKNYATSKWCLNELVKIIECMTRKGSVVLPVFYHVEPRDVRNQGGSFEKAFLEHAKDADQEKKKTIETWKEALKAAGELKGYDLNNQSEVELIQRIHEDIITRLNRKTLDLGDNIVGMDFHLEQLKSLIKTDLDGVHMVGIYGIGGIGKTTIAMAIYNDISSQFDGSSFLNNVGGKGEDRLLKLQKTLLRDTLKGEVPKFNNISEGKNVIKNRLRWKRVLIVLDDVDQYKQLETLAGKYGWYGAKSIIIITTKDIHLLKQHGVQKHYEVQKLNLEKSTKLFNWWAFQQSTPKPEFESLSNRVVKYAQGLPLALKVLGGSLFGKAKDEWESALHKLEKIPHMEVQSVLRVSYEKLDDRGKDIFLDIACFFKGEDKDFVSRILGKDAKFGIKVLEDRCLITISKNDELGMHDLVQQMGQEIVRQECRQEPGKRSRLWDPNDVGSVLARNTGTRAIEGLFIKCSTLNQIQFSADSFTKMDRLRLLKVSWLVLPKDLEFPSSELRYLHIQGCTLESLPTNFHAKNLVELYLEYTNIKQLWKKNEILGNLKVINLIYLKDLVEIPDFSSMPNLEILTLQECTSLQSLPRDFHKLEHLQSLSCQGCSKLKSFPKINGNMSKLREIHLSRTAIIEEPSSIGRLKALKTLDLSSCIRLRSLSESICNLSSLETLKVQGCSNLKAFPEIKNDMENLVELDLAFTGIKELPYSIGRLKALKTLNLLGCKSLGSLPENICNLSSLETLKMWRCSNLKAFPEIKNDMENLVELDLRETDIEELPYSIGHLKALKTLYLSGCESLGSLPESICNLSSLETLEVQWCSNLKAFPEIKNDMENLVELDLSLTGIEELPYSIGRLKALKTLNLSYCESLGSLPESICNLSSLETLKVWGHSNLKAFPEIKNDMENLVELDLSLTGIEELPYSIGRLKALKTLYLSGCENLGSLPESICNLSSLETLRVWGHSNLKAFPEIKNDMENLVELDLRETCIEELPYSIGRLKALKTLNLSSCISLGSLPESICNLSSLETLKVQGCSNLKAFPEIKNDMENLVELDLGGTGIEELPYSIGRLKALKKLNLSGCDSLGSLPESICNLSSLKSLRVRECPKLERLEVNLKGSHDLTCYILKQGVIWSYYRFSSLKTLNLQCNQMEAEVHNHHIFCLSSLVELSTRNSDLREDELFSGDELFSEDEIPSDGFHISSLKVLSVGNFNPMARGILSDIFHQSSLKRLSLDNCNLMEEGIPTNIWNLSSLVHLSLSNCSLKEGDILNHICHLSSLEELSLEGNHFSSIPAGISRLSNLRALNLSHCKKLQDIPKLPSSLLFLDVQCSDGISSSPSLLSSHSLFNRFKSELIQETRISVGDSEFQGKGMSIVIPRSSGILEGIRNQNMGTGEVTIELPQNWYGNNDLLGFALYYCVKVPVLDDEFDNGSAWESENEESFDSSGELDNGSAWESENEESFDSSGELDNRSASESENEESFDSSGELDNGSASESENEESFDSSGELDNRSASESKNLESEDVDKFLVKSRYDFHLYCKLTIRRNYPSEDVDKFLIESGCDLFDDDDVSDHVWVIYYPKDAIKEQYRSNQWTHLKASFNYADYRSKDCGIHLIYASCLKCQRNEKCQQKLCLEGHDINELPFIDRPFELDSLCLRECKNLESLPSTICELKSLTTLSCSGCSQLKIFPEILKDLEKLRELHLDGTAIEELPASIQHLRGLQYLNLAYCNNLVSLPQTICHLKSLLFLSCSGCSQLKSFPEILENMENLEELYLDGTAIKELPASIAHLQGLQNLHLGSLQCLEGLGAASIIQLSKLRVLDLSHCQKLLQIPELPQSLRFLDAHGCPCLETLSSPSSLLGFSLFKCFKSAIEEYECGSYWSKEITIFIPGNNGIPEWISHQKKGSEITIELPVDWYQDNDFLGFALYSVFLPLRIESKEDPCSLKYELNIHFHHFEFLDGLSSKFFYVGELSFRRSYPCCHNGGESNGVWVAYYPKVAIQNEYSSNEWTHLKASFHGKQVKVEECGFHLIYMPNIVNKTLPQDTNIKGVNHNHAAMIQCLDALRSCGTKSVLEDANVSVLEDANVNARRSCEDANVNAQRSCDDTTSTDHDHSPMGTITQNIDDNVVDAQDDEEDHMHTWLELLCTFVQRICCRRC